MNSMISLISSLSLKFYFLKSLRQSLAIFSNLWKFSENSRQRSCHLRTILENLKATGKRGHIVADTLLPTQMFPRLHERATFAADTNFVSGTQKVFLILFRNSLCLQEMFPSLCAQRNIMSNNVSSFASTLRNLRKVVRKVVGKSSNTP